LQRISTNLARLFAVGAAALAVTTAPAAEAAVPKSGIWRGDLVHQLTFGTYKSTFVITAYLGRIQSVVGTVRMECGANDPMSYSYGVRDVRVVHSFRTGRGPRVRANGAFAFRADGAYIHGSLSRSSAIGGASANYGEECHGTGRFNAQRRR
jgi:hypothetical protein